MNGLSDLSGLQISHFTPARNFLSLGLGLLALLILALLNVASTGVVRSGGDDDGSGIGGTGRMLVPGGGSGLGGTGLKPFVGVNDVGNIEILSSPSQSARSIASSLEFEIEPRIPVGVAPIASPVLVSDRDLISRDSVAIDISEELQRSLDRNALAFTAETTLPNRPITMETTLPDRLIVVAMTQSHGNSTELPSNAYPTEDAVSKEDTQTVSEVTDSSNEDTANQHTAELDWNSLSRYLLANSGGAAAAAEPAQDGEPTSGTAAPQSDTRLQRPERIQRPEIPPIQRYRPIQRAAILPPRIKPLSL